MRKDNLNLHITWIICFCVFIMAKTSFSQPFSYKKIVNIPSFIQGYDESKEFNRLKASNAYVDATTYLPKRFVKDASVDYTVFIQKAIDENSYVLMPNFPILINDNGLEIRNNSNILFNNRSIIYLKPSSKSNYEILRIHSKKNVKIFSAKLVGDRGKHLNGKGEWGMGISIISSSGVQIINANIRDCWGDGIYLGESRGIANHNITINNGIIDNNRRNGISVISADGLYISNTVLANTHGTNPQAGIDFEPNRNNNKLKDIKLKNIYTFNNFHQGVFFCLNNLNGGKNNTSIRLENHIDRGGTVGIGIMNIVPKNKRKISLNKLGGYLELINVEGINNKINFRIFDNSDLEGLKVNVKKRNKTLGFKTSGSLKGIVIN